MPSAQVIDLSPTPRRPTTLEHTVASYAQRNRENQIQQQESDALREIYQSHLGDGENIMNTIQQVQQDPRLGPTRRVETMNQLLGFQKYNTELKRKAQQDYEKAQEKEAKIQQVRGLEKARGLPEGSLAEFEGNPNLAASVSKPAREPKVNQADRPIDEDQLRRIKEVTSSPEWEKATTSQRDQLLMRAGVSNSNRESLSKNSIEEEKLAQKKEAADKAEKILFHKESEKYDAELNKAAKGAKNQLSAIKDSRRAIDSGKVSPTSLANIFKNFGEIGKTISNALLNSDEAKIQASVPAFLEGRKELFGVRLSDADLAILQDKLPDIGKSKEANIAILNLMERYSNASILRSEIANDIKKKNNGLRPLGYTDQIEERFDEMMAPVKIKNPWTRNVVDIPAYQASDYIRDGGILVKDEEDLNG